MSTIKNIHFLNASLPQSEIEKLDAGAALHKRFSNIEFKILTRTEKELKVRVEQGKHLSENYADVKTLITRTRELFSKFFPDHKITVHPVPFSAPKVDVVTPEWIQDRMLKKGVRIKDIVNDTGIDKTNISAWLNTENPRPMSQPVKSFFYYYFNQ